MSEPKSEFSKRLKFLTQLGVEYSQESEYRDNPNGNGREQVKLDLISCIKLPLTAYEWVALTQNDGQFYAGGCCGSASAFQDEVCASYRFDSGWFNGDRLSSIARQCIDHEEGYDDISFAKMKRSLTSEMKRYCTKMKKVDKDRKSGKFLADPWQMLALVWHIVKDYVRTRRPQPIRSVNEDLSDMSDAIGILGRGLMNISFEEMFDAPDKRKHIMGAKRESFARILPFIKPLVAGIKYGFPPSFSGWAIVMSEHPERLLVDPDGICLFERRSDAENKIKNWDYYDDQFETKGYNNLPSAKGMMIRPITVSLEGGFKLL